MTIYDYDNDFAHYECDEKDLYWSEELNKHDHKKYEVEVINTVKLRLMDRMGLKFWDLKPTFQSYVKRNNGKALIDLTFDAINVGLEVDEGHHARQKEADKRRELEIYEKMAINGRADFEICRVDVTHGVKKKMEDIEKFVRCVIKHAAQHKQFNWDGLNLTKGKQNIKNKYFYEHVPSFKMNKKDIKNILGLIAKGIAKFPFKLNQDFMVNGFNYLNDNQKNEVAIVSRKYYNENKMKHIDMKKNEFFAINDAKLILKYL